MVRNQKQRVEERRKPARDLIAAVLENMRRNLEPLTYSTLAPSRYLVYLHPAEYARLEGIVPILQEQTIRALAEELDKLNRRSSIRRFSEKVLGHREPSVQSAGGDWHVEFLSDPDGEVAEGDILIDSELLAARQPRPGRRRTHAPNHDRPLGSTDDHQRTNSQSDSDSPRRSRFRAHRVRRRLPVPMRSTS